MKWLRRFWFLVLALLAFVFGLLSLFAGAAAIEAVNEVYVELYSDEGENEDPVRLARQLSQILANFAVVLTAIGVWFEYIRRRRREWRERQGLD